ncbi:flavohemoglobin expression-modulating QEGLA motif protein [Sphingomonas lutea]|uniref:Flavohemoglobin expression-modulating QEGLA motif protein n=1 Tax=Sphingomonas lutea TaxID=1045317 RepID=A0A7G9SIS0_9SPHN|nr:flavohemoglobin expression-modulating QEGLA motif protein [Sphingomonas lutea]QNN67745.1 flavohemoglobin expression-modulating QEGLA motif protein [Sphingomonas lutea]
MSTPAVLREVPMALDIGPGGAIRQQIGEGGRLHMDRHLFFLVLNRTERAGDSLARNVALHSSSYLVWSPADDGPAEEALKQITEALLTRFDRIILISLYDQPTPESRKEDDPHLPPFVAWIGASDDALSADIAEHLATAMSKIEIDLRHCEVEHRSRAYFEPGVEALVDRDDRVTQISVGLPRIYLSPDGDLYPQLFRDLSVRTGDALLRAACAFADETDQGPPAHYRSLGRSAFLAAALAADRKLDAVATSFDFLLSVSPINTAEAQADFLAQGARKPPRFRYRPLEVDPDAAKRQLYAIDLAQLEDPLLEHLFAEKRQEIEQQLTMLATRNTPSFRAASMLQYGAVEEELLRAAEAILAATPQPRKCGRMIGASEVAKAAQRLIRDYRNAGEGFDAAVELRDDLAAGLMVSGGTLMISTHTRMADHRLDALLSHEVSIHLLTFFNGAAQGLELFRTGLAQYEGVQEGLGVFAEWAVGGLTDARFRLLAGRVVAVDAMLRGADFIETYRLLRDRGFREQTAFSITARVHRSGGLAKDAIYLRGFKAVCDYVADGVPLDPFWLGKIAPGHLAAVEELLQRGLVSAPRHLPEFLARPDAQARIARLQSGVPLASMLNME